MKVRDIKKMEEIEDIVKDKNGGGEWDEKREGLL